MTLVHKFVRLIPEHIENGVIYISVDYGTAIHRCCCGCGQEVVTPFSPAQWQMTFDGETISLYPSIGNWNFECKSHYWITNNTVEWAEPWPDGYTKKQSPAEYLRKIRKHLGKGWW